MAASSNTTELDHNVMLLEIHKESNSYTRLASYLDISSPAT